MATLRQALAACQGAGEGEPRAVVSVAPAAGLAPSVATGRRLLAADGEAAFVGDTLLWLQVRPWRSVRAPPRPTPPPHQGSTPEIVFGAEANSSTRIRAEDGTLTIHPGLAVSGDLEVNGTLASTELAAVVARVAALESKAVNLTLELEAAEGLLRSLEARTAGTEATVAAIRANFTRVDRLARGVAASLDCLAAGTAQIVGR